LRGERQLVFVTGEAGIGKTTLVDAFLSGIGQRAKIKTDARPPLPVPWIAWGQCIEPYGAGEAYLPVLTALEHLGRTSGAEQILNVFRQCAPMWLVQMPSLSDPATRDGLQRQLAGATRERMMRELAVALEVLTKERGLVLWIDDVQWVDAATLALLALVARRREPARLLIVAVYRSTDVVGRQHPVAMVKQELQVHEQCQELTLGALTESAIEEYLSRRFGDQVRHRQSDVARMVYRRTEGNPLFMVNVANELARRGVIARETEEWELQQSMTSGGVPPTLQQFIEQQLEHLSVADVELLETASVAGMEFSAATVAAGLERDVQEVEQHCADLIRRGHFLETDGVEEWPDGAIASCYRFSHALHHEVLSERVTAARRARLHGKIGDRKERGYGEHAATIAAELALHFEHGRDYPRALQYLGAAAQTAMRRRAPQEAITHLTRALTLLPSLPDAPERLKQELTLLIALGAPLLMTKGYAAPEVEETYARARTLCQQIGATPQLFPVLHGLWVFYEVRGELQTARTLGEEMFAFAQHAQDPALLLQAHHTLGETLYLQGELEAARQHLERAISLYDPRQHGALAFVYGLDPGIVSLAYAVWDVGLLGYPHQSLTRAREALTLARTVALPLSHGVALIAASILAHTRREVHVVDAHAAEVVALSTEQGFPLLLARGLVLRGWALVEQERQEDGMAQIRQGLDLYRATGAKAGLGYFLSLCAEAYGRMAQPGNGLAVLEEALAHTNATGERSYEAELYRLRGELLLMQAKNGKGVG
jgi:predicted ATPase